MTPPAPLPDWTPHRVSGADLIAGRIAPATRFRGHAHDGVHLCCVVDGGFIETARPGSEHLGAGAVRVSPSARHDIEFGPAGARCVLIELDADDATALAPLDRSLFLDDPWLGRIVARMGTAAGRGDLAAALALEGAVAELLAQIGRRQGARAARIPPAWLESVRERVCDTEGRQTLPELATAAGVHRAHLARAFRDHYGVTLGSFARRLMVERALRLLADADRPLVEVAAEAGFADQSHMNRAVRAAVGESPGRLRAGRGTHRATPVQDRPSSRA
jgi:AraC family transcriptional regulator